MTRSLHKRRKMICCLCGVLALVFAFFLYFPHFHECEGIQCQVCVLFSSYKVLWVFATAGTVFLALVHLLGNSQSQENSYTEFSLVRLKVKLSD